MPFIAYLSQTLNKNNKPTTTHASHTHDHRACLRYEDHAHTNTQITDPSAYKVCAFLLNKMLASTIQLSTPTPLGAGQPAQPHPHQQVLQAKGAQRQPLNFMLCDSSGPNSVSRPTRFGKLQVPRPHRGVNSTEKQPVTD